MKTCPKCGGRVTTFSPCEARYQPGEIPDVDPKANEIEQLQAENTRLQSKLTHACEEGKKLQAENVRLQTVTKACRQWRAAEIHVASMTLGIRVGGITTAQIICDDKLVLMREAIDDYTRENRRAAAREEPSDG